MKKRIEALDHLRVYAAITVLLGHAIHFVAEVDAFRPDKSFFAFYTQGYGAIVFVAVAGFVAFYTSYDRFGQQVSAIRFIRTRLERLVPLYWFFTGLWVAIALLMPQLLTKNTVDLGHIFASFFFVPYERAWDGDVKPVLSLGWVLNYIMWFNVIFAGFMLAPRRYAVPGIIGFFLVFYALVQSGVITSNLRVLGTGLMLVFCVGILCVYVFRAIYGKISLPIYLSFPLIAGLFMLAWLPATGAAKVLQYYGCVTGIVLGAAVTTTEALPHWARRAWSEIAAASYSIYLSQAFVLGACVLLFKKLGFGGVVPFALIVLLCVVIALVGGVVTYHVIERPLTNWVRRLTGSGQKRPPVVEEPIVKPESDSAHARKSS